MCTVTELFQNRSYDGGRVGAFMLADSNIPLFVFSEINYHPNLFQSELSVVSAMKPWLLLLLCGFTMMMVVSAAEGEHLLLKIHSYSIKIRTAGCFGKLRIF